MHHIDNRAIAGRLRALIGSRPLKDAAAQLAVSEAALRCSIDPDTPYPTIDVLVGAALFFGVDPTWILRGEYELATHRLVLDGGANDVTRAIQWLLAEHTVPVQAEARDGMPGDLLPHSEPQTSSS